MNKEEIEGEIFEEIEIKPNRKKVNVKIMRLDKYIEMQKLIEKLQKDNYELDRESQHYFDRIQDLQKENKELYEEKEFYRKLYNEILGLRGDNND